MKKICFFSGDITRSGGTERVAAMIANELAKEGKYKICFLSLCEQKEDVFYTLHPTINRYKLGEKWIQPGPGYLPLIPKLRRFLKEEKIDLIIDIDIVLDSLSIPASWGIKTKVLSWEHSNCFYEFSVLYRKLILKFSVKYSDYVVTLTETDKQNYANMLNRTQNIEAIHNPIEEDGYSNSVNRENNIITVGRLVIGKGTDYLSEIAAKILSMYPSWKWYVLGDGEERDALEKMISDNNLQDRFVLTGLVNNVGEYLAKSKLFVFTSKSEGLPMCLLEAKAHELPCISFDIPTGPSEIIEDGVNGFLVRSFDCEDMIHKISTLIENEELLNSFSANAKTNMEKFRMDSIMKSWNRVLDSLCE